MKGQAAKLKIAQAKNRLRDAGVFFQAELSSLHTFFAIGHRMTDTTFFNGLNINAVRWWLDEPFEINRLANGMTFKGSLGAALWQGEATLARAYHRDLAAVEARLARLIRAGETFLAHDPRHDGPRADPGGVILGGATPVIHTVASNNRDIRISGLPAGYVLSAGDYIGWIYGDRYAMHRLVTGATASGAGLTPLFEVAPFVQPGVVTGSTPVVLVRPPIRAMLDTTDYGSGVPLFTQGARLRFIQTLG